MATLTSKYQLSLPKAVAQKAGLSPGDELDCELAGDVIRVRRRQAKTAARSTTDRLTLFDLATERQERRNRTNSDRATERGWSRDELHERER